MATFSLGTSGITPGAPGVYINEQAGRAANADLAEFSTVYMLVETDEDVSVTRFPFNVPIAITSLNDYKELIRVGTSTVPEGRIPLLSYNCVNEFFQNAQVGDLRVVRVGTPNEIVELEFFPSATKINTTSLPSSLLAGDKVFVQMEINGLKLVAGDGSTGYTANGEWLGVPVTIPVNYVAGDEANNRRISAAIAAAVAEAIESNPAVRSSVYVRDFGQVNDLDPASNSENSFVSIAATTFDGNVSVVTQVLPVGTNFVFMQNAYDVENIVGGSVDLERVPQDYTQCIATAFDGQQDQGYLITPTAYAQFDAEGRAKVGAAAAAHCASNSFKWMALADPGPFLITDVNKYEDFTPHQAAADLVYGNKYLVDNAIYEWVGSDISPNKLAYQTIVFGESAEIAVNESANIVSDSVQVGLLDNGQYTASAAPSSLYGVFPLDEDQFWPVTLPIQQVALTGATGTGNAFNNASIQGTPGTFVLNGTEVFLVAPPADIAVSGEYSLNKVYLAKTAADASNIFNQVVLAGGSNFMGTTIPTGAIFISAPFLNGTTCLLSYQDPYWNLPVTINGQTSDLIENISGANVGVNTLHFPGTLQDPTETYRLSWITRTIFSASAAIANYTGTNPLFTSAAAFNVANHGLRNGQKIFFTQPVTMVSGSNERNLVSQTTKITSNAYWVKVIDANNFALANSLSNYTVNSFIVIPSGYTVKSLPTIFYGQVLGGGEQTISPIELLTIPTLRGRKYEFDTSSIFNEACASTAVAPSTTNPTTSIYIQNNSVILGDDQINPYGEDLTVNSKCGYLPEFNLTNPNLNPTPSVDNAYCTPTVDQFFQPELYFVPAINGIQGGTFDPLAISSLGPIDTLDFTSLTGGVGGTIGYYPNIPVTGGTGSEATLNLTIGYTALVGPIAALGVFTPGTGTVANNTGGFSASYPGVATGIASGTAGTGATLDVTVISSSSVGPAVDFSAFTTTTPDAGGPTTYNNVATSSTSGGTGLQVDVTVDGGGAVTGVVVSVGFEGVNYATGDIVTFTLPGGGAGTATVDNVTLPIVVSSAILNAAGAGYDTTSVLNVLPAAIGGVTGFTVNVSAVTLPTGVTAVTVGDPGVNFTAGNTLSFPSTAGASAGTIDINTIVTGPGTFSGVTAYPSAAGLLSGSSSADGDSLISRLVGVYFSVLNDGVAPDGVTQIEAGGYVAVTYDGSVYSWVAVAPLANGGDLTAIGQPCYGSQVEVTLQPEQAPPRNLWRFDAITSTEIFDDALRGVGFNGVPQAVFIEAGVDNVNRLLEDSQRYFNPFGFIAYYGPYIENGAGQFIPPSPYVTGVAVRRYRAEGYQFPPAGVKYQLADAVAAQIPINSAQQNLLNPKGCNAVRTLPGYPQTAVFIWGGRTRVNNADAQQRLYQFVNTRVILNVVYGSLRSAFDSQIFNVIDGFGIIYNQIISVGNSVLNQLYVRGALFGARPKDAFQVICDARINPPEDIENGIVNAKVFVTPVPTLERIQIDLIRVAIGKMQEELDIQGLGENNQA